MTSPVRRKLLPALAVLAVIVLPATPALAATPSGAATTQPARKTAGAPDELGASPAASPTEDAVEQARKVREQAEREVAAFRAQVEQATAVLTEGSRRLEAKQAELARTRAEQAAAEAAAEQALERAAAARSRLATMAAASFRSPVPDSVQLALTTTPEGIRDAVIARADLDRVRGTSTDAVREAKAARVEADSAVRAADQLTDQAAEQEAAVAVEVQRLAEYAKQSQATLETAAVALSAAQDVERVAVADAEARAAAERSAREARERARAAARANRGVFATCEAPASGAQANGFLDPASLCPLDAAAGHGLVPDAAAAFNAMNAAYQAERGTPICVTDSYRSYAAQVDVYARKPQLAAVPGSSNHGLGTAVDFCGGVERFGSEAHLWMKVNASRFGWFHPAWAQQSGSRPEAWHWEFAGDDGS